MFRLNHKKSPDLKSDERQKTHIRENKYLLCRIVVEFLKMDVLLAIYHVVKTKYRGNQCISYRDFDVVVFLRDMATSSHPLLLEGFRAYVALM